jgi:hypothetical protein
MTIDGKEKNSEGQERGGRIPPEFPRKDQDPQSYDNQATPIEEPLTIPDQDSDPGRREEREPTVGGQTTES